MSLLDKVSLCITPNAYKESKLYSVIPSDGSGDMDVVRATTATRVNESGLIEVVPKNLFTYSESNLATYGTVIGNATDATTSINGFSNSIQVGNNSVTTFVYKRNFTPTIGVEYTLSLFLQMDDDSEPIIGTTNSTGDFSLVLSGVLGVLNLQKIRLGATNIYRVSASIVATSTNTQFGVVKYTTQSSKPFRFTGIQLEQGSTATSYFPTTDRLNIPRIDYTNGGCPSILVEPQRTNLLLRSEEFDNASWTKTGLNTTGTPPWVNVAVAPNGTTTAEKMIPSTGSASRFIFQGVSITSGTTYTQSIYVKASEYSFFQIAGSQDFDASSFTNFNLTNGTLGSSSGGVATITNAGNGWYRLTYTLTASTSSSGGRFVMAIVPSSTAIRLQALVGNDSDGLFVWGAQLEAGTYATSYIPTVASAVTRNQDVISKTGISGLIGQTEGTMFVEINNTLTTYQGGYLIRLFADGNNEVWIRKESGTSTYSARFRANSVNVYTILNINVLNGNNKIAFAYKSGDLAVYLNGVQIETSTSTGAFSTIVGSLNLGFTSTASFNDRIKSAILWKERLSNTELTQLTTL